MKKGIDRQYFQDKIVKTIWDLTDLALIEEITEDMTSRGYDRGHIRDIMEGNAILNELEQIDLGVLADTIHKHTGISMMKLDNYLEEAEINAVRSYKITKEKKDDNLLVFENVTQMMPDMWTTVVSAERIANLYRSRAVNYNFETQRQPRHIKSGEGGIIKTASVNDFSVDEIREDLISGVFIPNTITFNVPIEHSNCIKFDEDKNRLIITGEVLDILDGYHRSLAILGAVREVKLDYNFILVITNFNVDKSRQLIIQEDKRNPISKAYIKSIDERDEITAIINNLNTNSRSELRGLITTDFTLVNRGVALVTFQFMHAVMEQLWTVKTISEAENVSNYLREFFNELVGIYPNEFKHHIKQSRGRNSINKETMFLAYLTLAKELEGKEGWRELLPTMLNELNIKEGINKQFNAMQPFIMRKTQKSIKYFIGVVQDILMRRFENGKESAQ